jgi:hypothetical protein
MQEYSKVDLDDLDLEDRDYMNAVRSLRKVNLEHFLENYLKVSEPEVYDKLISICVQKHFKK